MLETKRLKLEPLTLAHSTGMHHLWARPEVCEYAGATMDANGRPIALPAESPAESDKIIRFFSNHQRIGAGFRWAVLAKTSRAFIGAIGFNSLGFEKLLDDEVAIFGAGYGGFILQRYYQKDWAENFMMQLVVDDLDGWWKHIEGLDLTNRFGVRPPKAPEIQPYGLRVAYVFDPCGVLWHIAQRDPDAARG